MHKAIAEEMEETEESTPLLEDRPGVKIRTVKRLITVEPIFVLYMLAYSPTVSITDQFVLAEMQHRLNASPVDANGTLTCNVNKSSHEYIMQQEAQSDASRWMIMYNAIGIAPSILVTALLGPYTDKGGRKIAILLPIIGSILRCVVTIIMMAFKLPIQLLFLATFMEGIFGSVSTLLMASFAYIADISTKEQRAFRILVLESSLCVGIILSNIAMGYMIKMTGFMYPFIVIITLYIVCFIYGIFLQETVSKSPHARLFTTANIKNSFMVLIKKEETNRRWKLLLCLFALFMINIVDLGDIDPTAYTLLDSPLCFTPVLIGYFTALNYLLKSVEGAITMKLFYRYLRDTGTMVLGCISAMSFYVTFAFAETRALAFICK